METVSLFRYGSGEENRTPIRGFRDHCLAIRRHPNATYILLFMYITMPNNIVIHAYNLLRHTAKDAGLTKRSSKWEGVEKHFLESNPACSVCQSKVRLNVHHKKPFHLFPQLELDPTNLVTLCMSKQECHLLIGHGDNFKAFNPHIEEDIKTLQQDISKFDQVAAKAKADRLF